MKEFSIEAFKNGAQVVTRDGREVEILRTDVKSTVPGYTIVGLIEYEADEVVARWSSKGEFTKGEISPMDLMLKTQKRKGWINVYRVDKPPFTAAAGLIFETQAAAKASAANSSYLDTIEIEWRG